jgi:hypothetical protein
MRKKISPVSQPSAYDRVAARFSDIWGCAVGFTVAGSGPGVPLEVVTACGDPQEPQNAALSATAAPHFVQ